MKAIWRNQVLAESDETIVVENNHYFPASSLDMAHFTPSDTTTHCPWKGDACYYSETEDAAKQIEARVAFWRGVEVI